jgi:uncharacterized protein (TIGR00266 family)
MTQLDFDIVARPDFAALRVQLPQGQTLYAEPSAMATMDPAITLKAGFKGGLLKSLGRAFAGESMVLNTFIADRGPGDVLLAPGAAGEVLHHRLRGTSLHIQRGAYLAHSPGVEIAAKWGGARGFFSGQGLVLLRASGDGDVFFSTFGALIEIDVSEGYYVDTGYVVAFEDTLAYQVTTLPGLAIGRKVKSFLFGGEGLVAHFRGQGKLWVQTRHIQPFLSFVHPYRRVRRQN